MRLLWYSEHPIIRPLFFANIAMLFLPKQPIALPASIGLGFCAETIIRSISLWNKR